MSFQSELVPIILEGSATALSRGYGQMLNMEAEKHSFDPDSLNNKTVCQQLICTLFLC